MSPPVNRILAVLAFLLAHALTPLTTPAVAQRAEGEPIDRVVAVVNQEAITERELKSRVAIIEKQIRDQGRAPPPQGELTRQILEDMILARARAQYAKEVGISPTEADIDRALADVAQQNSTSVQQMREKLAEQGIGMPAFREQLAGDIISLRLREREATSKVTISEAEVDAQVAKRGGAVSNEYEIAQILLRLAPNPDPAEVQTKTELAQKLAKRAAEGDDFSALAREYSDSPEAMQGGSLGWRSSDRLPELFVNAVSRLQPGQVAPVVRSPAGLHLLKLIDKRSQAPEASSVEQTHVRHILLPAATPAAVEEATRRLAEFKRNIESGAQSFESLARQFSIDGSAAKGGDLGWLYPGDTVPDFERAMKDLKVGAISDPVRTQFGVHLLEVLERKAADNSPEQMRAAARQALREQKADEAYEQWLREIRDRAYVEYRLEQP